MFIKSLQIAFVVTTAAGGALAKNLPVFYKLPIFIEQSAITYEKEDSKKEIEPSSLDNSDDATSSISTDTEVEIEERSNEKTSSKNNFNSNHSENNANNQIDTASPSENLNSNISVNEQTSSVSTPSVEIPKIYYDRTTSIYENDNKTLIRVEYYVNNKLTYYSRVEQFDVSTTSYVEKIYKYNYETNTEVLIRTDVYSNGKLVQSY